MDTSVYCPGRCSICRMHTEALMNLNDMASLSCYKEIAALDEDHGVYLVQHTETQRVFVKKLITEYDVSLFRFLKENHIPNTPIIYELFEDAGYIIVIEEYISGQSLQTILNNRGPLPEQETVEIICQLCSVLNSLHSVNPPIIHRDIKPSNIMISQEGNVTLLDMDAAKWYHDQKKQDTKLLGTQGYAAPEQYGFGASDVRTDIFSLGVLMNVMLTGCFPAQKTAGGRLGRIIEKCIQLDPNSRFSSVSEIYEALTGKNTEFGKGQHKYIRWLPPGFRSLTPWKMILVSFCYIAIFAFGLTLAVPSYKPLLGFVVKTAFIVTGLVIVFFSANWMNILDKMKITKIKPLGLRIFLIVLFDLLFVLLLFIISGLANHFIKI